MSYNADYDIRPQLSVVFLALHSYSSSCQNTYTEFSPLAKDLTGECLSSSQQVLLMSVLILPTVYVVVDNQHVTLIPTRIDMQADLVSPIKQVYFKPENRTISCQAV